MVGVPIATGCDPDTQSSEAEPTFIGDSDAKALSPSHSSTAHNSTLGDNSSDDAQEPAHEPRTTNLETIEYQTIAASVRHRFHKPRSNGIRVDICLHHGAQCRGEAAQRFCRLKGYSRSSGHTIQHDVGYSYILGDQRTCRASYCDAYRYVDCERPKGTRDCDAELRRCIAVCARLSRDPLDTDCEDSCDQKDEECRAGR